MTNVQLAIAGSLLIVFGVSGCAGDPFVPKVSADHPANPAAPTAPLSSATRLTLPHRHDHTAASAPSTATAPAAGYVCPMHEHVMSNKPDDRCPECYMKLVPVGEKGGTR